MSLRVMLAAARLELQELQADRAYVLLTIIAAMSFIALISLFGLTASDAPMALVVHDRGPYARPFVESLVGVPHAFRLTRMTPERAAAELAHGSLVGAIVIPDGFSDAIAAGETVPVDVEVDNVNVDIITDVQRALPAAIVAFGAKTGLPGLRTRIVERDVWPSDTSFLPYVTVSGLALAALIVAGTLGALAIARELEAGTLRLWRLSPAPLGQLLGGKIAASLVVAIVALTLAALVIIVGYGVRPAHPLAVVVGLVGAAFAFTALGAWIGALVRRTLVIVPLFFGLAMPLYIDSGALEPTRLDGETVWRVAHLTPLYYVVAWLEWAFFDLRIAPEPLWSLVAILFGIGAVAFVLTRRRLEALA